MNMQEKVNAATNLAHAAAMAHDVGLFDLATDLGGAARRLVKPLRTSFKRRSEMDASKIHMGVVLGLEDLSVSGDLYDKELTLSYLADHITERVVELIQDDYSVSD